MSDLRRISEPTDNRVEQALDEADEHAKTYSEDMTHEEVFLPIKAKVDNSQNFKLNT